MENRKSVPVELAADVIFASDMTCCVCNQKGKSVQIHHIDGNRDHNEFENLAVLCLECHNKTLQSGGFDRKLTPPVVITYRDNWLARVRYHRKLLDERAVAMKLNEQNPTSLAEKNGNSPSEAAILKLPVTALIYSLPDLRTRYLTDMKREIDTGTASAVVHVSHGYIKLISAILVGLSGHYGPDQFGNQLDEGFFSEIVSSKIRWYEIIEQPDGPGTGGAIARMLAASRVVSDLDQMVEDLVWALVGEDDTFDYPSWKRSWHRV